MTAVRSKAKLMVPPKRVYFPISMLHCILPVANLLAHYNISQICYWGQISLQSAAVPFILLALVHQRPPTLPLLLDAKAQ